MPRSHNTVLRRSRKPVPYGIPGSNPGLGAIFSFKKLASPRFEL